MEVLITKERNNLGTHYILDTALRALHGLTHLVLATVLRSR